MIRELARKFSALKEISGDVTAEMEFTRGKFTEGVEILKSHRNMKLICASKSNVKISVKFITPQKKIRAAIGTRIQSDKKTWRTFTASEVENFIDEVDDTNEIYKLNPPIVPGFLILESILNHEKFSAANTLKLKFKHFITAGEPLTLQLDDKKSVILSAGEVKVVIHQS